jgi:hypothetical protein
MGNEDLNDLDNLPDMDESTQANMLDMEDDKIDQTQASTKISDEKISFNEVDIDADAGKVSIKVDLSKLEKGDHSKNKVDEILDVLDDQRILQEANEVDLEIKEETKLFYSNEYVGDLVDGEPVISYDMLNIAVGREMVEKGYMEEVAIGRFEYTENALTILAVYHEAYSAA